MIDDSITDGSTAPVGSDLRWPDIAQNRLKEAGYSVAFANAGIGGDRFLKDAGFTGTSPGILKRLGEVALELPNVRLVVLAAGINDISWPGAKLRGRELAREDSLPLAADIINGYEDFARKARSKGIMPAIATITPYAGDHEDLAGFYNAGKEQLRQEINTWIRTSNSFEVVISFDRPLRDPETEIKLASQYDSGDQLHPSAEGFRAMGELAADEIAQAIEDNR